MQKDKYTQKSLESLKASENIALEYGNPTIDVEHLMLGLITVSDSLILALLKKMTVDVSTFRGDVTRLIEKKPKVTGDVDLSITTNFSKVLAAAEKEAQRQARARRVYSCKADEDCIIVDKDPCGCAIGPKGVVAINVNYLTDFNALNSQKMVTKSCSEVLSREKECSPSARAVCKAHTCKITY